MNITVIGAGYVGLVSGVCLADVGHRVICVDSDQSKVDDISRGDSPIYEDGLDELIQRNIKNGRFTCTSSLESGIIDSDISVIAVGTPFRDGSIDLGQVRVAAESIGRLIPRDRFHVVCVKSTVIPGTTDSEVSKILEATSGLRAGVDFGVCMNPEFLAEGSAVKDFMNPDRIVIGTSCERTINVMKSLYSPFEKSDVIITSATTAEMGKYAANSLLATLISFTNEVSDLCARCDGVDVVEVMRTVIADGRISPISAIGRTVPGITKFLHPGAGFGGSCFPKDVNALVAFAKQKGVNAVILEAVLSRNAQQPQEVIRLLMNSLDANVKDKRVSILGLSFKPGTNDIRESPSIKVIDILLENGALVTAFDPVANDIMKRIRQNVSYATNIEESVKGTDAVVIMTSWPEFEIIPRLLDKSNVPLIDGRRMFDSNSYPNYVGIGLNRTVVCDDKVVS